MSDKSRKYETSHPWLKFELDARQLAFRFWMLLGEARSKCEHIAGVPLRPDVAQEVHQLYLAKGVFATTSIEGNTLTEEQVRQHLAGTLSLPPSQEYLRQEVANIVDACNFVTQRCLEGQAALTPAAIKDYNRRVLAGLPLEENVAPGKIRTGSVVVMRYVGAPAQDCDYLLERLCQWLNAPEMQGNDRLTFAILRAILAHLYVAWIHPFGDGNGRTARLIEFQILLAAGVPTPATHLLSNHYNTTRAEYYRQLDYASKSRGDVSRFLEYAVGGFVEGLRDQLEVIRQQQWEIAWRDYIFRLFKERELTGKVDDRRRELALTLSTQAGPVAVNRVAQLSPRLAGEYRDKTDKTIMRDLDYLVQLGLARRVSGRYVANREAILQFLPQRYAD